MNVETIETALATAVASCTGIDDVRWVTQTVQMRSPTGLSIDLRRSPLEGVGHEERRRVASGTGPTLAWNATQVGQRVMRVTVRAESTQNTPYTAMDALAKLRTRLYRPAILSDLRDAGLALQSVGPIADYDASSAGRSLAAAACELVFNVADTFDDATDSWIATVNATATIDSVSTEITIP